MSKLKRKEGGTAPTWDGWDYRYVKRGPRFACEGSGEADPGVLDRRDVRVYDLDTAKAMEAALRKIVDANEAESRDWVYEAGEMAAAALARLDKGGE